VLIAAVFVPTPPLLVPEIAAGSAADEEPLRAACDVAIGRALSVLPDVVIVVGCAPGTGRTDGSWDWRGFGVAVPEQPPVQRLPLALAMGAWLLDRQPASPPRHYLGVSPQLPTADCLELGRSWTDSDERAVLLVCGDGTARRSAKAPGYYDPAAEAWDAAAAAALGTADTDGLLRLDADVAAALLASGRAPWQVLAGAAQAGTWRAELSYVDAPYGVAYIAGTWLAPTPGDGVLR
jgi:hypothetical protein